MNKLLLLSILFIANLGSSFAQELNCIVQVNADQVQTSDRRVFEDMEKSFAQFLNNRKWTDDTYLPDERIRCNLNITISDMPSIGSFTATVQIQSARPVFNSNYESIVLNFADRDWQYEYIESQPLEYSDNTYISNLTSMLAYYAYVILGMDYDTFSELGGTEYYQRAQDVVNNAQNSNRPGWQQIGNTRNRYWLIDNLTNTQMASVRKGLYTYHRLAMDTYMDAPDESRVKVLEVLKEVQKARNNNPNSILVRSFLDAKSAELINMFSEGSTQTKKQAYDLLTAIDPSNRDNYKKITSN